MIYGINLLDRFPVFLVITFVSIDYEFLVWHSNRYSHMPGMLDSDAAWGLGDWHPMLRTAQSGRFCSWWGHGQKSGWGSVRLPVNWPVAR